MSAVDKRPNILLANDVVLCAFRVWRRGDDVDRRRQESDGWRQALTRALETGDLHAIALVPKTDLHCHGMLSAPLQTYTGLLGHPLSPPAVFGSFRAFAEYIVAHLLPALTGRNAVRTVIRSAFERLPDDGVVYAEMSFDLMLPSLIGASIEEFADIVAEEAARVADRVTIAPELGIARTLPAAELLPALKTWVATGVCRSLDLYDDETAGSLDDFVPLYRFAEAHGLKLKAHAGELCGAERVRESVLKLNLHAVQHGVRAAESPEVAAWLAQRGTLLHLCPTSNYALGVCRSPQEHPAHRLVDQGVRVTVNTDDFTLFGASVSRELLNLQQMGFSCEEIVRIVDNGLREMPDGPGREVRRQASKGKRQE